MKKYASVWKNSKEVSFLCQWLISIIKFKHKSLILWTWGTCGSFGSMKQMKGETKMKKEDEYFDFVKGEKCYFCDGIAVTDFCLEPLEKIKNYDSDGNYNEILKVRIVRKHGESIDIFVSNKDIVSGKWVEKSGLLLKGTQDKRLVSAIGNILFEEMKNDEDNNDLYCYRNGWHNNPELGAIYVVTGGAITKNGFTNSILCQNTDYRLKNYFMSDSSIDFKKSAESLKDIIGINPKIFAPLFLTAISGISQFNLKTKVSVVLYIVGKYGSGKTELAKVFAGALTKDEAPVTAVNVTTTILKKILKTNTGVVILDDVKKGTSHYMSEKIATNTDVLIRSIALGKITAENDKDLNFNGRSEINVSAYVTGEMLPKSSSEKSRCLVLDADGFLNNKKNSIGLSRLQKDPILCNIFKEYILWLCTNSELLNNIEPKLKEIISSDNDANASRTSGTRVSENIGRLKASWFIFKQFLNYKKIEEKNIIDFERMIDSSLEILKIKTYEQIDDEKKKYIKIVAAALSKIPMRKLSRTDMSENDWDNELFLDNDAIYVTDSGSILNPKALGTGSLERECLIIQRDLLINAANEALYEMQRKDNSFLKIPQLQISDLGNAEITSRWKKTVKSYRNFKDFPCLEFKSSNFDEYCNYYRRYYEETLLPCVMVNLTISEIRDAVVKNNTKKRTDRVFKIIHKTEDYKKRSSMRKGFVDYAFFEGKNS